MEKNKKKKNVDLNPLQSSFKYVLFLYENMGAGVWLFTFYHV